MGRKIAVFDSGLGGITVLSELKRLMPNEEYVYYGDSANAPYGDRSDEELLELCTRLCSELIGRFDIKCFVVACNTTSSRILGKLADRFPGHTFIGIEPAVEWAVSEKPDKNILVLATRATIGSARLKERIESLKDRAAIFPLAAREIVPYVEEGNIDSEEFMEYLYELLSSYSDTMDAVVLGCTHFPFVKSQLKKCFRKDVAFYDGAVLTARAAQEFVESTADGSKRSENTEIIFLNSDPGKVELERMLLDTYESKV